MNFFIGIFRSFYKTLGINTLYKQNYFTASPFILHLRKNKEHMREKNFFKIACLGLVFLMHSCSDELGIEANYNTSKAKIEDGTVKNGRLYFPNKESLELLTLLGHNSYTL